LHLEIHSVGRNLEESSVTETEANGASQADERLFLSAIEVGRQLGVCKSRVYALAAEGLLPTVRLGRRLWFPKRGLEALANSAIQRAEERTTQFTHQIR
jgi:excisionase family DNA binding protein